MIKKSFKEWFLQDYIGCYDGELSSYYSRQLEYHLDALKWRDGHHECIEGKECSACFIGRILLQYNEYCGIIYSNNKTSNMLQHPEVGDN